MRVCDLPECGKKHFVRGYCAKHYARWRSHGDVHTVKVGHRYQPVDAGDRIARDSERRGTCLVFTKGRANRSGHRLITHLGKSRTVHRVAWELVHGPIPPGLCVLHRCDVPDCVNVQHLFLGTVADNNRDRDQKGRHTAFRGSKHVRAKLTEWKVQQIRRRVAAGETIHALAREFGVSQRSVQFVVRGETWKHVQVPGWEAQAPPPSRRLTLDEVERIRRELTACTNHAEVARRLGVSRSSVRCIAIGRTWKQASMAAQRLGWPVPIRAHHGASLEVIRWPALLALGHRTENPR